MKVYAVSEFVAAVQDYLEEGLGEIAIQGEVADFRKAQERLVFFELKDKTSRVACFMMAWELKTILEEGVEIRVYGRASLFKTSGKFHVRVREIELVGAGALTKALLMLKSKLEKEGLFAEERKRALPRFPERVGLITSPDAAAYTDVLRVMRNRWTGVTVRFVPSGVQGPGAIAQLVRALSFFNGQEHVDVIILTRGGGSLEDLQAFNSEDVARAIFASRTPVVVGVGHERDWTIADLVADRRASTPSNAAEVVVPDRREILFAVETMANRIDAEFADALHGWLERILDAVRAAEYGLRRMTENLSALSGRFAHVAQAFEHMISTRSSALAMLGERLTDRFQTRIARVRERVMHHEKLVRTLSPQATLNRGYSVTYLEGKILTRERDAMPRGHITTRLAEGSIDSVISETD